MRTVTINGEYHGVTECVENYIIEQEKEIASLKSQINDLSSAGIHTCHDQCKRRECVQSREIDALRARVEIYRGALEWAKEQYWNRCYAGSGTVKAVTLAEFDKKIDDALKGSGV